jgi:hypothetical protein
MASEMESEGTKCYIISGQTYNLFEAISTTEFCKFDSEDGATQKKTQSSDQGYNSEAEMVDDS